MNAERGHEVIELSISSRLTAQPLIKLPSWFIAALQSPVRSLIAQHSSFIVVPRMVS